jgi:hypothetical protein
MSVFSSCRSSCQFIPEWPVFPVLTDIDLEWYPTCLRICDPQFICNMPDVVDVVLTSSFGVHAIVGASG